MLNLFHSNLSESIELVETPLPLTTYQVVGGSINLIKT